MAVTTSAHHGGNFMARKVPTVNLEKYFPLFDARTEPKPDFFCATFFGGRRFFVYDGNDFGGGGKTKIWP